MKFWQKIAVGVLFLIVLAACAVLFPAGQQPLLPVQTPPPARPSLRPTFTASPTAEATLTARPTVTLTPAETPSEPRKSLLDEYLPRHAVLAETAHFVFYAQDGYFPVELERWKAQVEEIYAYVADRLGAESGVKIALAFLPAQKEACPIRGLASSENPPVILIFADPGTSETYLRAVLAHEVGHAVAAQGLAGGLPNEIALSEGLATWASGKYWNAWMGVPTIHHLVRGYIDSGRYLPLPENVDLPNVYPWQEGADENCLARRDQVYSQWASFVDYLIEQYGWEKTHRLFESARTEEINGQEVRYPSDYAGIFGKPLEQLEAEWLDWVMRVTQPKRQAYGGPFSETGWRWHTLSGLIPGRPAHRSARPG